MPPTHLSSVFLTEEVIMSLTGDAMLVQSEASPANAPGCCVPFRPRSTCNPDVTDFR